MSWSRFIETDTAKVATFVALVGILLVIRAEVPHYVRLGQFVATITALLFVGVLAYRDEPTPQRAERD